MTTTGASAAAIPTGRSITALLSGPILPTLMRLTLPNLAAMLVLALVAICETAYVGILGTTPLAAIALVFPLVMLTQMLSAGAMGGGVSSAISRALGAGELERAEALAFHAIVIGATAGFVFSVMFVVFGQPIFRILGGSGEVLDQALVYANIALAGAILTWLLNTTASIVHRSCGGRATCACLRLRCSPPLGCRSYWEGPWGSASAQSRAWGWRALPWDWLPARH
jgi:Na+-driven multidrug efflux pump